MHRFSADGVEYWQTGAGWPVLLLHGGGANAEAMRGIGDLIASGRRVLMLNLAGYGATPAGDAATPPVEAHLHVVARALALAGDAPVDLIGHSMGGMLALKAAARAPTRIRRLVAIEPMCFGALNTGVAADAAALAEDRAVIDALVRHVDAGEVEAGLSGFIDYWGSARWRNLPPHVQARLIALAPQLRREAEATSYDATPASAYAVLGPKTLLLAGSNSPLPARRIVDRLAEAMPGAQAVTIAGAGHMAVVTHPALFADAINDWLSAPDTIGIELNP